MLPRKLSLRFFLFTRSIANCNMPEMLSGTIRRRTAIGVVGLVLVTAGCLGTPGTEVDNPEAVTDPVESRYEQLDGFQATMIQTVETDDRSTEARATVTFDKGDYLRIAYHTGPKAGSVTVVDDPSPSKLFAGTRTDTQRSDASTFYGTVVADLVRENEVVFDGRERLDGRPTAVFSVTPPGDDEAMERSPERRIWIDTDRVVPLRIESNWTADGETVTETIRFEDISLGIPGYDASAASGGAVS